MSRQWFIKPLYFLLLFPSFPFFSWLSLSSFLPVFHCFLLFCPPPLAVLITPLSSSAYSPPLAPFLPPHFPHSCYCSLFSFYFPPISSFPFILPFLHSSYCGCLSLSFDSPPFTPFLPPLSLTPITTPWPSSIFLLFLQFPIHFALPSLPLLLLLLLVPLRLFFSSYSISCSSFLHSYYYSLASIYLLFLQFSNHFAIPSFLLLLLLVPLLQFSFYSISSSSFLHYYYYSLVSCFPPLSPVFHSFCPSLIPPIAAACPSPPAIILLLLLFFLLFSSLLLLTTH